jgi:hypothetical protein
LKLRTGETPLRPLQRPSDSFLYLFHKVITSSELFKIYPDFKALGSQIGREPSSQSLVMPTISKKDANLTRDLGNPFAQEFASFFGR